MIEIIGIILLSIVAVIMIMAIIGYFMEKKQNKVVVDSSSVVLQDDIKENTNAVTNANIPDVMNFNEMSNNLDNEKVAPVITNSFIKEEMPTENMVSNSVVNNNMIQNPEVSNDNMINTNAAMNAEIPQVMDFNKISDDLNKKEIASNTENSSQLI